ncbi:CHAT domain-containing protein [Psychromonas sp. MME2]|uniref:CHAT domain-containing protein n=1 Tax=Psychromonas sp. MME2 TaxID=3231033 RepID=UPI00339C6D14
MKKLLVLLTMTLILSGCAYKPQEQIIYFATNDQHRTAINIFEKDIGEFEYWSAYQPSLGFGPLGQTGMASLCESYLVIRDFMKAQQCLEYWKNDKALYEGKIVNEDRKLAHYNSINSAIFLELGNAPEAYRSYKLARKHNKLFTKESCKTQVGISQMARTYANGAIAALNLGYRDEAAEIVDEIDCIEWFDSAFHEMPEDVKIKNVSKARVYLALGNYSKAQEAMVFSQTLGDTFFRTMDALTTLGISELLGEGKELANPYSFDETYMLGKIAQGSGQLNEAEKIYTSLLFDGLDQSTHASEVINRPGIYYQILYDMGRIAAQQGRANDALNFYQQAIEVIEEQRTTINTEASKIGFIGNKEAVYQDLVTLLIEQGKLEQAFVYAERSKARALIDTLASKQEFAPKTFDDQPSLLLAQLNSIDSNLMTADYSETSRRSRSTDRGLLRKTQRQLQTIKPELASLVTVASPELKKIQQRLATDETLLEFYGSDKQLFAFILSHNGIQIASLNSEGLADTITAFRHDLQKSDSNGYQHNASLLYQRLFKPLKNELHTKKLIIVPHGPLHYLPFNALYTDRDFLIDHYDISILPSASVMAFLNKRVTAPLPLLVLGNPELGDVKLALPGAEQEAKSIASQQTDTTLLLRSAATETQIKQNGAKFKTIHFASHGIFDPDAPLSSGLLLAADNSNDGILTVRELYDLNLNAELVTLSACETGLGKIANGDDVVGFTRGFLYAGTNSIISSLWKVDDHATSQLMQNFYSNLTETPDKRLALKQAQLAIKADYNRHPYYWAAFQLTGR